SLALCHWARDHPPNDATFLVPPQETEFRYYARRAIVVNFKGVPQLSSELPQWRDRLRDVLGASDLSRFGGGFFTSTREMARVYDQRPSDALRAVAQKYGARYVVATRALSDPALQLIFSINGRYFLYALTA